MADLYFPPSTGVSIIGEPGSFFVSSAFTLVVNVISKEVVARDRQDQARGQWHNVSTLGIDEIIEEWRRHPRMSGGLTLKATLHGALRLCCVTWKKEHVDHECAAPKL